MSRIAKVVVDLSLDREFDYVIPPALAGQVRIGSRVLVPFGRSESMGYVVGLADRSEIESLKAIESLASPEPYVNETMLRLARWVADYYCATVEQGIRAALPGAVRRRGAGFRQNLFVALADGQAAGGQPVDDASLPDKQRAVLRGLRETGGDFLHTLTRKLGITAAPVHALARKGIVRVAPATRQRSPSSDRTILRTAPLSLMPEQSAALERIRRAMDLAEPSSDAAGPAAGGTPPPERVVLLYGVTGSGKTEVYLQAIDHALNRSRGAIVLVPEISLTPQTVERFVGRFGDRVAVLHSHLSDGERHDEWHRIRAGKADIVVGARSAVFAPVHRVGLIVVDEEHEPSYKQEDPPRYNARDVAVMRAHMEGCAVVLGSATPSLESWVNARKGKYALATLPRRADDRKMPAVRVVDMRIEAERTGSASAFSRDLIEAIRLRLDRAEQTILFLNRRGFANCLLCPQCGYVARCGLCSVAYTYHRQDEALRCHICGAAKGVPPRCPECHDPGYRFAGIGTQRVEAIVAKCFPRARVQRMDADVTRQRDSYDRILGDFRVGKTDILIGTQMVAKGLHFPNVTLVGVIHADLSLHMPDFRAGERTFQLLAQVAGRAGRGDVPGEVIVQTFTPFHPAVQAARRVDFAGFADQEIEFRRELSYPPAAHLVCLTLRSPSQEKAAFAAAALERELRKHAAASVTLGAASPAPLARAKGYYRYQILLRCASTRSMTAPVKTALRALRFPTGVSCAVDVDAHSLL